MLARVHHFITVIRTAAIYFNKQHKNEKKNKKSTAIIDDKMNFNGKGIDIVDDRMIYRMYTVQQPPVICP